MHNTLLDTQEKPNKTPPIISRKIFVGCIPGDAEEKKLIAFFKSQGNVEHVKLKYKTQLVNAGYCIVSCGDERTYKRLLNEDIVFQRRNLECRPYMEHSQLQRFRKTYNLRRVYIYNISMKTSDKDIKALFELNVGPVENAYCIRKLKKRKGQIFGYVLFKAVEDAENAVRLGQLNLRGQLIKIKKFIDKEEQNKGRSYGKPQHNYKSELNNQNFMPSTTAHNSWDTLEGAYNQGLPGQHQTDRFISHIRRQNNKTYYSNYDNQPRDQFNHLNRELYLNRNLNNDHRRSDQPTSNQHYLCPPNFNSRSGKPASVLVFELQRPIWRNHSKNNLRYNLRPKLG